MSQLLHRWTAIVMLALCWSLPAHAHKSSDSYLHLTVQDSDVVGRWDIALRDLDVALDLDGNADGQITWGEVRQRNDEIASFALQALTLRSAGSVCIPGGSTMLIDRHSDGAYAVLEFTARCAGNVTQLQVAYHLFADLDAGHRGLLNVALGGQVYTQVLGPAAPLAEIGAARLPAWRQMSGYLVTGIQHIWSGFDHLLFLFSLLLPAVLLRRGERWEPQSRWQPAAMEVFRVVTAFTAAHSLTLGLATFGVLHPPARLTESAIALSVVAAALNNVYPLVSGKRWLVAFCFGLIHGFGFASVLSDLGLPRASLALALVGFNIGVEA
ncbi:MAG: HupE/UreJ family protein, partial [Steroidobacteraceae bacterium]